MKKKKMVALIAMIVVIALLAVGYFVLKPKGQKGSKSVIVDVVHSDGSVKTFQVKSDAEFLDALLVDNGIVEDNRTEFGLTIMVADGELADFNKSNCYWSVSVNDVPSELGCSQIPVSDGDHYKIEYLTW